MDIILIMHAADWLGHVEGGEARYNYMIGPILSELLQRGHKIEICKGLPSQPIAADLAIMHVDLTVVPPDYVEFGALYPRCVNLRSTDISKRLISGAIVDPADGWNGPVMVKSNLNSRGMPEARLRPPGDDGAPPAREVDYAIYDSLAQVPVTDAANAELVIEKFLPERDGDNYACRFWTFAGDQERCTRVVSNEPIVKASNLLSFEFCDVPEEMRNRRRELGFDFGKFDFVIHDGHAVLLDANNTPGVPPVTNATRWPIDFADGLLSCLD